MLKIEAIKIEPNFNVIEIQCKLIEEIFSEVRFEIAYFLKITGQEFKAEKLCEFLRDGEGFKGTRRGLRQITNHFLDKVIGKYYFNLKQEGLQASYVSKIILTNIFGGMPSK